MPSRCLVLKKHVQLACREGLELIDNKRKELRAASAAAYSADNAASVAYSAARKIQCDIIRRYVANPWRKK